MPGRCRWRAGRPGAHAVLHPIQGRLVAGGGDAVQGHVEADDPEHQCRGFLVMGLVGPPGGSHFPDVPQAGEMIKPPQRAPYEGQEGRKELDWVESSWHGFG